MTRPTQTGTTTTGMTTTQDDWNEAFAMIASLRSHVSAFGELVLDQMLDRPIHTAQGLDVGFFLQQLTPADITRAFVLLKTGKLPGQEGS